MARVLVIHRKPDIAAQYARRLAAEGWDAGGYPVLGASGFRQIRANPPAVILIDLTELPYYGRTMGVLLREQKSTRNIPLVFLKGDPAKAARVREVLPDAIFAVWPNVTSALQKALERGSSFQGKLKPPATPVAQKLRIEEGARVALLHPPPKIREILSPLPKGARLVKDIEGTNPILLFAKSAAALGRELPALAPQITRGRTLWICWPKRTSLEPCDLTLTRIAGMTVLHGLAGSKICAVDETWSGVALTRRR